MPQAYDDYCQQEDWEYWDEYPGEEKSWKAFFSGLWPWLKLKLTPVIFCIECGKPDTIFGKFVGDHSDCLPF